MKSIGKYQVIEQIGASPAVPRTGFATVFAIGNSRSKSCKRFPGSPAPRKNSSAATWPPVPNWSTATWSKSRTWEKWKKEYS
jgi:hypothetical protein